MDARGPAKKFGGYELIEELGRGAMGAVYLARRPELDRFFALKVMLGGADRETIARFEREAKVASRIDHPGVVRVVDAGMVDASHFYVMEYCRGVTLRQRLDGGGPLDPLEAAKLVRELTSAVVAAHHHGVIHRDLKPANVILDEATGQPRITDFGLARDLGDSQRFTKTGDVLGTPYYMAPEQLQGSSTVDARADVYALGVILYECLAGKRPFQGRTAIELADQILGAEARSVRADRPDVPAGLEAIVRKAMSRSRDDRHPTAVALLDDLDFFLRGGAKAPRKTTGKIPLAKVEVERAERGVAGVVGFVVVLVLVLGGGGVYLWHRARLADDANRLANEEADRVQGQALEAERLRLAREELDKAVARAEARARSRGPGAHEEWKSVRAIASGDPRVELSVASFLLRRNSLSKAIDIASPLIDKTSMVPSQRLEALRIKAEAVLRSQGAAPARPLLEQLAQADPNGARGLVARARLLELEGKYAEARVAAQAALSVDERPETLVLLARLTLPGFTTYDAMSTYMSELQGTGFREQADELARRALAQTDRAIELAPDDSDAYVARSEVRLYLFVYRWYVHRNLPPAADNERFAAERRADLDHAVGLAEPEPSFAALCLRGRLRYFFNEPTESIVDLDRALKQRPRDPEALVLRALATEKLGAGADETLLRAFQANHRATWIVLRHFGLFGVGPITLGQQVCAKLRTEMREGVLRNGRDPALRARWARVPEAAREKLQQGMSLARHGAPLADARAPIDSAVALAPGQAAPLLALARLCMGRGRSDEALAILERARSLGPDPYERGWIEVEALHRLGRRRDAIAAANRVASEVEGSSRAILESRALCFSGDTVAARAKGEQAAIGAPWSADARMALAAALVSGGAPEPDAALDHLGWAFELEGTADAEVPVLQLLAHTEMVTDTTFAIDPRRPKDLLPRSYDYWWPTLEKLGIASVRHTAIAARLVCAPPAARDLRALAIAEAEKTLAGSPRDAVAHMVLGHAKVLDGDGRGAFEMWSKARSLEPGMPIPKDGLDRLAKLDARLARELER